MLNTHETLGIIAGILGVVGFIPYIISILRGKTRPNQATWFIWTLVGGLLAFSYLFEGDKNTIWLPLGYFLGPLVVALLSFRYGYSTWTRLDKICIIAALISLLPWLLANNATGTLLINVLIDSMGAIPTIVKAYREPETEDFTAWLIFLIANTIEVLAITDWNMTVAYPIYLFLIAGIIIAFILKDKIKRKYTLAG